MMQQVLESLSWIFSGIGVMLLSLFFKKSPTVIFVHPESIAKNNKNSDSIKVFQLTKPLFVFFLLGLLYSIYFINKNNLPASHIVLRPLFELSSVFPSSLGFEPIPQLITIPKGSNIVGETKEGIGEIYKSDFSFLTGNLSLNEIKQKFGYPGVTKTITEEYRIG